MIYFQIIVEILLFLKRPKSTRKRKNQNCKFKNAIKGSKNIYSSNIIPRIQKKV